MLGDVSVIVGDAIFQSVLNFATEKLMKDDWLN
jgi:hypothetical protein